MIRKILTIAMLTIAASFMCEADDIDQSNLRLNPEIENESPIKPEYSSFPFLKLSANHIQMNGADWSGVKKAFQELDTTDSRISIVYLGDSHIQADFGGSVLRKRLSDSYGNGGRGIIIPFKQAGTNQPFDYTIRFSPEILSSKLLKLPWATEMPFSGIGIQPMTEDYSIEIKASDTFNAIKLHFKKGRPQLKDAKSLEEGHAISIENADSIIFFSSPQSSVRLNMTSVEPTVYGGIELIGDKKGVSLHSIGNNGATYSSYGNIDHFGKGISALTPKLVIIALGTNEAFGRIDEETLENDIDNLVNNIRRHNPNAGILLVSPTECYRKIYRRVKGRRRRSVSTVVNTKTLKVRNVIRNYAKDNNIAFYDTYDIFGGTGSAAKMKSSKVLGKDGVHFTAPGYRLVGSLLADALLESIKTEREAKAEQ